MSFEQIRSLTHTLAFRLSLYYSIIFTISLLTAFLVFYLVFGSIIEKNRDLDLRRDLEELSSLLMKEGFNEMKDAIAKSGMMLIATIPEDSCISDLDVKGEPLTLLPYDSNFRRAVQEMLFKLKL